ncbi:GreA/GreB family elongation factor [Actinomyces radicidentis]|uniref:Transcription elongation factor GreA n=1 Tax=Actinomyces radicidentis TaxID=111015 RepID=A0A0X8JDW4_ACTRD|nr:transcription elongation factor GreA [Actinomyces radicidentis]AMD86712.1 transcription elongation factor GreA [Actinomyces radicidentis]
MADETTENTEQQGTWLTQEAFDRLTEELKRRQETDRKEIAQRVEAARQEGDLRENAGYHAAREEAALNEARIVQLTEMLENAQIGEVADDGRVSAGMIVTAKVAGKEQAFALGGQEITADVPEGVKVFSPDAPLGKALMGHKAGETVSYAAPNGKEIKAEILDVKKL